MTNSSSKGWVSPAVMKSNIRRFVPIMILSLGYFLLIYILPGMMSVNQEAYIESSVSGMMMGIRVYCAAVPLITSMVLFNFLHKKNAVLFHHSLPVRRTQTFASLIIAGFVIINLPLLIFAAYVSVMVNVSIAFNMLGTAFVCSTFTFAICTLAGIVSGTTVMHFITACWFNFLPQSLYFVIITYAKGLLTGFSSDNMAGWINLMSPETTRFTIFSMKGRVYFTIAVLIFVLAGVLYNKLKLERTEDAITYQPIKIVLNAITSIYAMAIMGVIFYAIKPTSISFIAGSLVGAIIGVLVGYMVLNKTFKVFNKSTLSLSIIIVVISMLFSLSFLFDVFGFEKKIPNTNQIASVKVDSVNFSSNLSSEFYNDKKTIFKSRDVISNVTHIHKLLMDNPQNPEEGYYGEILIEYKLKNDEILKREYFITEDIYNRLEEYYKDIYESKEFKENYSLMNLKYKVSYISVENGDTEDPKVVNDILDAIEKDFQARTFEENLGDVEKDMYLGFGNGKYGDMHIYVHKSDVNTIKALKKYQLY